MKPVSDRPPRSAISRGLIAVGALVLLSIPSAYVVLAFSGAGSSPIPAALLIISATVGMALIGLGAVLGD